MKCCKRELYAVQTGDYVGEMFAIVNPTNEFIGCLSIPKMENVEVPIKSFEDGRNHDIIKYVEKLPRKVYSVVEAQYKSNENSNNRRQQFNTPNISYSKSSIEKNKES
jgi:hypothetical protein|tara:strand:- start:68 stop:391 length:324 start_codon:yes stop_codon:yes gene_type:complete